MRIVSKKRLRLFWEKHPSAKAALQHWFAITRQAHWRHFGDVRATFASADQVRIASAGESGHGKPAEAGIVAVFNIGGNEFRLIASINYRTQIVYTLAVMTHAEYDKQDWKRKR